MHLATAVLFRQLVGCCVTGWLIYPLCPLSDAISQLHFPVDSVGFIEHLCFSSVCQIYNVNFYLALLSNDNTVHGRVLIFFSAKSNQDIMTWSGAPLWRSVIPRQNRLFMEMFQMLFASYPPVLDFCQFPVNYHHPPCLPTEFSQTFKYFDGGWLPNRCFCLVQQPPSNYCITCCQRANYHPKLAPTSVTPF